MTDTLLVVAIVMAVCGVVGTVLGLIGPYLENRKRIKERLHERSKVLRQKRKEHVWPSDRRHER